jgi:peptide-methionine (R)-S-oxide reductase
MKLVRAFLWMLLVPRILAFSRWGRPTRLGFEEGSRSLSSPAFGVPKHPSATAIHAEPVNDKNRRTLWTKKIAQGASLVVGTTLLVSMAKPALAASGGKSRTDGYQVQKTEDEWKSELSPVQFDILRRGGTEQPGFSILEKEKRRGSFRCAGCGTPLFSSNDKFDSGTGWPSFARALPGVEVEEVNPIVRNLAGAELRCATCGGHLGDVFRDGFLFAGTEAAVTGERYCIDGAALVFYPDDQGEPLRGDTPKSKEIPSWLDPPTINAKDRTM